MRKSISFILIFCFFSVVLFPLYGRLFPNAEQIIEGENRMLAPWPDSDTPFAIYPQAFEAYFDDHVAYRAHFVNWVSQIPGVEVLDIRNNVAVGKDGFLFYMAEGSQEDILRKIVYTRAELDEICAAQEATRARLLRDGIEYVVLICPDKHTIYPEYLPIALRGAQGRSRLDQYLQALRDTTGVHIVDARNSVLMEKESHLVFHKTDTHWNANGAFAAYQALSDTLEKLLPKYRRMTSVDYDITDLIESRGGDMAIMLRETLPDYTVNYIAKDSSVVRVDSAYQEISDDPSRMIEIYENPLHPDLPTAVIFRDSFCNALLPFIAESFSRAVFIWSSYPRYAYIEAEQPDIVIQEYVERSAPRFLLYPMDMEEKSVFIDSTMELPTASGTIPHATDVLVEQTHQDSVLEHSAIKAIA